MWPARKRPKGYARPKDYVPVPLNEHIALTQQPFWTDLPDILQAQVLVMIDMARRPKGMGWKVPKGEMETLLWAGTPHIRTKILLQIFFVWSLLLVIPSLVLVEVVQDLGGWLALVWAVCSVFIFVPYISRGSREVYALTTHRAFSSCRTMFCSIESAQVPHEHGVCMSRPIHTPLNSVSSRCVPLNSMSSMRSMRTGETSSIGLLHEHGDSGAHAERRPHGLVPSEVGDRNGAQGVPAGPVRRLPSA